MPFVTLLQSNVPNSSSVPPTGATRQNNLLLFGVSLLTFMLVLCGP